MQFASDMKQMPDSVLEPEIVYDDHPPRLDPRLAALARWMDSVFEIPGTGIRIGFDPILGLVPGLGDALTTFVSLYILASARRYGVPRVTLLRMAANIGIDLALGAVPIFGDMFDVFWKSNVRNVALIEKHVTATPAERRRAKAGDWLFVAGLTLMLVALLAGSLTIVYGILYLIGRALTQAGHV